MYFDFRRDLKVGEYAEKIVLRKIQNKYPRAHKKEGNFKGYDIWVPETKTSIEVKNDMMACRTGNYFIETACGGFKSGINCTKADWYVIIDKDSINWIKTSKLKKIIKNLAEKTYPPKGKDKERSGKLIKVEVLKNNCVLVEINDNNSFSSCLS